MVQYNVVPEETYAVETEYDPELPSLTDAVIDEKEYVELGDTDAALNNTAHHEDPQGVVVIPFAVVPGNGPGLLPKLVNPTYPV